MCKDQILFSIRYGARPVVLNVYGKRVIREIVPWSICICMTRLNEMKSLALAINADTLLRSKPKESFRVH